MSIRFKGIDVEPGLARVIPHVTAAEEYGGTLQHLQSVWDNLSLLGQLSGTAGADMTNTRRAFGELAVNLLNQLGKEALKKCLQEMGAKAQVAINILVRNLFERTADIGFLACDEDIRAFLRKAGGEHHDAMLAALRRRFGEYVRKYSVYSDIILLDRDGNVLVRLRDEDAMATSADPIIRAAMTTTAAYVESYAETDLVAGTDRQLLYAYRVTDGDGGPIIGVLCLCFRFESETGLIFSNLVNNDDWTVVTMLDQDGVVIATSDPMHIPLGAKLTPVLDAEYRVVKFGAMEYIATSRSAQPYQGYAGLGWYGHAMVPIQHAFGHHGTTTLDNIEDAVLERIIDASALFSEELRQIPSKAEHIQRELNRSVWNGNASQGTSSAQTGNNAFSKILLKEISDTGVRTKDVFEGSITDLHQTVVTSLLHDNQFHAALAIDIMDRNLYERANDCRWWALAAKFAELLSQPECSVGDRETIAGILRFINGLYTVYTNLIVFDAGGTIVATSTPDSAGLAGTKLSEEWVARVLGLQDAQGYAVSAFEPSALYDGRPTYIYGAAIRTGEHQRAVGGVAIVFDAEPQFAAMLKDALPRDSAGEVKNGGMALFIERDGRVISSSDERFRSGDVLAIDAAFRTMGAGAGYSGVTVLDGIYYAVGAKASSGYREYKGESDSYRNDVIALVLARLCDEKGESSKVAIKRVPVRSDRMHAGEREDVATFRIGGRWFAARSSEIVEAIDAGTIVPLPHMPSGMAGCIMYRDVPLPVLDLSSFLDPHSKMLRDPAVACQLVVMSPSNGERFGLMVDDLGEIAEVLIERITPLPPMVAHQCLFADTAFAPDKNEDGELIIMLRADRLCEHLADIGPTASAAPASAKRVA